MPVPAASVPLEVAFAIMVISITGLMFNPYGAFIFAMVSMMYAPQDLYELGILVYIWLPMVLLANLVIKGRQGMK